MQTWVLWLGGVTFALHGVAPMAMPAYWKCRTSEPPELLYAFLVDVTNRTVDGKEAQVTRGQATSGSFRLSIPGKNRQGEPIRWTLELPSGSLTGEAASGGTTIHGRCEVPAAAIAEATPASTSTTDKRYAELARANDDLEQQVLNGKLKQQAAARLLRQKFIALFPEQASNAQLNEYFAYAEVIGEKVDRKKLTPAEGNYELARKMSEIQERQARMQADVAASQATIAKAATDEAAARRAAEEASARRAADEALAQTNEQRLAVEKQMLENQQSIQRQQRLEYLEGQQRLRDKQRQESLQAILRLLNPPRPNITNCTGQWMGGTWISNCINR
jgi:hypothetical protein